MLLCIVKIKKDVHLIKEAADHIGMDLWITRQVFQELRWYLRREVERIIQIDETLKKEIKEFIESIPRPETSLPQPNDMSLVLAAMSRITSIKQVIMMLVLLWVIRQRK